MVVKKNGGHFTLFKSKNNPLITKKIKGRLCPWISSEVKSEMNLKDQLLRKARRANREIDWSSYKRQRNKVNSQIEKMQQQLL